MRRFCLLLACIHAFHCYMVILGTFLVERPDRAANCGLSLSARLG
jgi:hypothetical protein